MPKNATRPSQDKHENGAYLFPEIDDPAFEEAMTSAIAKIMAGSSDLSKAAPGEQLEYLTPGEKPPGETPVRTTPRGARGYYPSEVVGGEEEAAAPREAEPTEEREIEAVQAPEAKPELSPPFGSTLVEGYADRRIVPRTLKSEGGGPPTHLYRVMDKRQYDDAVKEGELKPAPEEFGGDRRIHAAGKPNFQYAEPKPTVLVAIEYSDDDGWAARQAGFGDITAATYNPIPISKVTVLAEGANGRELRDNYNSISEMKKGIDDFSKLLTLETALEYFIKAEVGERLEYLSPGEKAPGDTSIHTTPRGARGYYPSEVAGGEEEAPAAVAEEPEDVELPEEEREVEAVQPSDINEPQEELFDPDVDDQYETELIDKLLKLEESGDLQAVFEELYPDQDWSELDAGDERILGDEEGLPNKDWRNLLENIEAIRPSIPEDLQRRQDFREWNSKIDEEGNPKGINVLQKFNEGGQGYVKRIIAGTQVPKNMDSHMMQPRDYFNQLEELKNRIPIQDLEPFYDAIAEAAKESGTYIHSDAPQMSGAPVLYFHPKRQYAWIVEDLIKRLQALPDGYDNPLIKKIIVDVIDGTRIPDLGDLTDQIRPGSHTFMSGLINVASPSLLRELYDYKEARRLSESSIYPQESVSRKPGGEKTLKILLDSKVIDTANTRLNRLAYFPDGAITQFQERASRIDDLKEDERLLPPLEDWPKKFQNLFEDIWRKEDPSTLLVKLIDELYKSTPYGLFHLESKRDWEHNSSSPLAGVLKESASRILDGPIVYHKEMTADLQRLYDQTIQDEIEEVYVEHKKHFPSKKFVDQYMKVQKQLTHELLDMAFPDVDDFELFRGLGHRDLSKELENIAKDQAEWDQASREEEAADADEEEEEEKFYDTPWGPEVPIPDFDKLFSNLSGLFEENPITSWSLDYHAASANFARDKGSDGVVLRRRVSKKDIWSSFLTHAYDGNELEMIVIPHKDNFTLGARYRDGEHSIGLERGADTYSDDERVSSRGLVISNRFSPSSLEGSEYREHLRIIEAEKKDLEGIDKAEEDEQESKKSIIIDDAENEDWIKEVRKKLEEKKTNNLSKLLVLDTVTSVDDSIRIGNLNIPIEVATNPASGLSGRDRLAPNTGMLFIFDKSPVITMKGMKFPLDIVWMADNRVVDLTENALVPVLESASLYTPKKHATTALEINGGEAQTLGIKIGDSVDKVSSTQSNLSKLLVLETALEYFIKAEAGERLEYLTPGEKAPGDTRIHTTARGARGYYPSEVAGGEEETDALEPEEEREIEAVQAPAAEPPGLVQERERQGEQKKLLDALDVISPEMIKESGATNVITLKGARSIAQKQGLLNSNGVNEENLLENAMRVRPKYNKVGQRVITVWHGTTAAGAKGIIEDGRINAAQTGGPSGSGFNLSPTAARSWAGGKAIGREVKGLDSMPVVLQFDIRLEQLRDAVGDQQEDSYTVSPNSTVDYIDVQHMNLKIVYSEAEGGWPTTNLNLLDQQYTGIPRELLQDATITTGRLYSQEDVKKIVQKQMTFSSRIKNHYNPVVKPAIDRMLASALKGLDGEGEDKAFADGLRDIPSWQIDRLNGMHIEWDVDPESATIAAAVQPINGLMTVYRMGQMLKGTAQDRKIRGEYLRGVLVHELAHTIASPQGNGIPTSFIVDMEHEFQKAVEAEDGFVSTYSSTNPAEFFAECYKAYITATDTLRDVNPSMFEMMEKLNQADSIDSMSRPFTEEDFTTKGVYEKHSLVQQWQTTGQSQFTSLFHALSNAMNEVAHDKKWIAAWGKEKLIQDSIKRNQGFLPDFRQRIENQIHHAIAVGDTKEELLRLLTHSESKVRGAYARQRQKEIDQIGTYYGGNTDISSALLKFVRRTINQAVEKSPYYGKSEPWLSAYGQKDKITAEEEQQWGQFFQQEQLLQKQSVRKRSKIVKKAADFLSSFVIKDPEEVGEPITRESARFANKKFREKKRNLSKFLVLETAVEYLAKVESGKREYLAPGEKAPEGLKEYPGSRPGVRYYVPGESKSKQEFPSMHTLPSDVPIQPEFPREEREIEAVSPRAASVEDDYREQFAAMADDLEDVLSSIRPEHKQFLGTPFDDSKLIGDNLEYVAFTDGSFQGSIRPSGSGIHSEYNFTVFIEGKPFIYKVVPGENRAEHLSYSIDRALGLDVVPYIKPYNMDIDKLHKVFQKSQHDFPTVAGQRDRPPQSIDQYTIEELKGRVAAQGWGDTAAAGHFMEFCETCPDSEESAELIADMLTTTEGREEFFKLMLLDYVSGNDDRHSGNWLVTKDKKALAIDNGFGGDGGYAPLDETINRDVGRIGYAMKLGFPFRVQNALKAHFMDSGVEYNQLQGHLTRIQDPEMLGEEAENTFDKYYNLEKIQKALAPINWDAQSVWPNIDDAREAFRNHAVKWMIRGSGGKAEGDYSSEVPDGAPDSSFLWIPSTPVKAINDTPEPFELPGHFRENKPSGFLNRIRNWIRLGGPEPKSSAPSSRGFHPEFEGDTPPSQRGGPQQGRRGRN